MRIPADQARQMFGNARVARLATVGPALAPHLVPVTFAVIEMPGFDGDVATATPAQMIVFAVDHKSKSSTALRRLDNIAANPQVCFLVDRYDDDWQQLWWVRADASAAVLDGTERRRALTALTVRYRQYQQVPPTGVVVGSVVSRWTGWRAAPA